MDASSKTPSACNVLFSESAFKKMKDVEDGIHSGCRKLILREESIVNKMAMRPLQLIRGIGTVSAIFY
jgi:hypothetical protein